MAQSNWIACAATRETIADRYRRIDGFTSGFDYMRLLLAMAVVVQHSGIVSYGASAGAAMWGGWTRIFLAPILLMFFALSGFLVAGSLKKNPTIPSFVTLRAVRLVPALAVEVLLSALVLGPLLTEFSLRRYFTDWYFIRYFTNIVGRIHMELPGVFLSNPLPVYVNLSLWTVPYELECYLALIVLWLAGVLRHRWVLVGIIAIAVAAGTIAAVTQYEAYWATNRPLPRALIVAFLGGIALNLFADRVRLHWAIFAVSVAGMVATTLHYQMVYLAAPFAAYNVVFLGMMNPPRRTILFSGDYSYGLYLFAFPIQQAFAQLLPGMRHWYLNAAFTIVVGLLYAGFSWWCVEKPLLARKKVFVGFAERGSRFALRLIGIGRARPLASTGDRIG